MKKQTEKLLSQTFEEYAEREIPASLDLWSTIQQELGQVQSDEVTRPLNLATSKNNAKTTSKTTSNKESTKMLYPKRQSWALGGLALVAILAIFLVTLSVWLNNDILGSLANQPTPTKFVVPTVTPTVANLITTPTVSNLILTPEPSVPNQTTVALPTVTNNVAATTVAAPTAPARPTTAAATPTNKLLPSPTTAIQSGAPTINPATPTPAWTGNIETIPQVYVSTALTPGEKRHITGTSLPTNSVINIYADAIPPYDTKPLTSFTTDAKGQFVGSIELPNYNFTSGVFFIDTKLRAKAVNSDVQIVTFAPVMLLSPNYKNTASLKASSDKALAQKVVLTGSGYPANTELQVIGEVTLPDDYLGTLVTDKQGNFTVEIELTPEQVKNGYYTIRVRTFSYLYESFVSFGSVKIQPSPTPTPKPAFTPTAAPQPSLPTGVVTAKPATPTPLPVFNPSLPAVFVEGARGSITLGSGLYFSINGDRFAANTTVNIYVDAIPPYDTKPLTSFITDANGRFSGSLIFPDYNLPASLLYINPKIRATPADNPNLKIYVQEVTYLVSSAYKNTATLKASSTEVTSQKVVLTGSGYPPNVEMPIYGGVQNPGTYYGTVTSDAQGRFAVQLDLNLEDKQYTVTYYKVHVYTSNRLYGATVTFGKP